MAIRTVNSLEELQRSLNEFEKNIRDFILVEVSNKSFSFTLQYHLGTLDKIDCTTPMEAALVESLAPSSIPYTTDRINIFGYVATTINDNMMIVTDLEPESGRIAHYTDRLNILSSWGFTIAQYNFSSRKFLITDVERNLNHFRALRKELIIIPENQTVNSYNNYPIVIK